MNPKRTVFSDVYLPRYFKATFLIKRFKPIEIFIVVYWAQRNEEANCELIGSKLLL